MKTSFTMRFLALPNTVNFGGKVHGGTVMSWIDQAAYACATAYSSHYCVTAFVGGIKFVRPIKIGAVVEVDAKVAYTGKSSMNIAVNVRSGDLKDDDTHTTTECAVVMVAVDENGSSIEVPALEISDEDARLLAADTRKRLQAANA